LGVWLRVSLFFETIRAGCGNFDFPPRAYRGTLITSFWGNIMDFGLFNILQQRDRAKDSRAIINESIEQTRAAERLGFAHAWFVEHHFSNYSLCPSPLTMAAYAAGVTEKIRLGTAVLVPPLHTPARLLAEIAVVDTLSNGRLDLGVGSGYQTYEFERFGVDIENHKAMTNEMLDMMELGLANPNFSYDGEFYQQPPTAINVRPVQTPHPPIWNASKDAESVGRAARKGYNQFFSSRFASLEELVPVRNFMDKTFQENGRDPDTMRLGLLSYCCISDDPAVVDDYIENCRFQQRIARSLRERRESMEDDYWVEETPFDAEPSLAEAAEHVLAGDVKTVTERAVAIIREVRPSHMTFYFQVGAVPQETAIRSMERWVNEVIPSIEKALGAPIASINEPKPLRDAAE
jgi:alkanesulfonate monooxygenase SsuD/methylene tetrahydromethanopterin reductase-like flavin-dependent oxidoreductase (luciferase family)